MIQLFQDLKQNVTSAPILAQFDPDTPISLKTDWSTEGMGWILMQPSCNKEYIQAMQLLKTTGKCNFDLTQNGARLQPIEFGSRICTAMENKLHTFVRESAAGRWAISQNHKYLWGAHFYWMCDCIAIRDIFKYDGKIILVTR